MSDNRNIVRHDFYANSTVPDKGTVLLFIGKIDQEFNSI